MLGVNCDIMKMLHLTRLFINYLKDDLNLNLDFCFTNLEISHIKIYH